MRPGSPARLLALLLALVAALSFAACGQTEAGEGDFSEAETEGIYIEAQGLEYQVQVSRQLNPQLASDQSYFEGIEPEDRELGANEVWFGVFLRIENHHGKPIPAAEEFEIRDTQENVYRPVPLPEENVFAYQARDVPAHKNLPTADTPPEEREPNGSLLLFKLRRFSFDNRPLDFLITGRGDPRPSGGIKLDV